MNYFLCMGTWYCIGHKATRIIYDSATIRHIDNACIDNACIDNACAICFHKWAYMYTITQAFSRQILCEQMKRMVMSP
jgi:hypothetical protein